MRGFFSKTNYAFEGGIRSNLQRIAEKVNEDGWSAVTDMLYATIYVREADNLESAYKLLDLLKDFTVVRITNNLKEPVQNLVVDVVFQNSIICEIEFLFGDKPITNSSNDFITELLKLESVGDLQQKILMKFSSLAENGQIYNHDG